MNINNFIDPIEERQAMEDEPENLIEHIAAQFGPEQDAESDEEDIEQPKMKISDTLAAVQQIWLYKEQQDEGNSSFLSLLTKYEQEVQDRRINERQQMTITAFFAASSRSEAWIQLQCQECQEIGV